MNALSAHIHGIGSIGPGFQNWPELAAILSAQQSYQAQATAAPATQLLPPAERRRVGLLVKIALSSGQEATDAAQQDPKKLASIFSSSGGDGDNCHNLCQTLASEDRSLSPTRFHNSVHNAPSGYWSIATGSMAASTSLCAYDASFTAGLLEAVTQVCATQQAVLLVCCDNPYGGPLGAARPIIDSMSIAFVLSPHANRSIAKITLSLDNQGELSASPCAALATLQHGIPCARALPLLNAIARQQSADLCLEYLTDLNLRVQLTQASH